LPSGLEVRPGGAVPADLRLECQDTGCAYSAADLSGADLARAPDLELSERDGSVIDIYVSHGSREAMRGMFPGMALVATTKSGIADELSDEREDEWNGWPALSLRRQSAETIFVFNPCPLGSGAPVAEANYPLQAILLVEIPDGLSHMQRFYRPGCGD
jgi:hypothetical protein